VRSDVVPEHSFGQQDPVWAYWLARCERFRVRAGRRSGVVQSVQLDEALRPQQLVVRFAFRQTVVPADSVQAVVPAKELLVIEPETAPRKEPALRQVARDAGTMPSRAAAAGYRGSTRAGRWIAPRIARGARASARAVVFAVAWALIGLALAVQFLHARCRTAAVAAVRRGYELRGGAAAALAARRERRATDIVRSERPRRVRSGRRMQAR